MTQHAKYLLKQQLKPTMAPLSAAVSLALGASGLQAATITVDTLDDGSLAGQCTLRDAVAAANADTAVSGCTAGSGADEIVFDSSLSGTLLLTEATLLLVQSEITITGPGATEITISGNDTTRILGVNPGASMSLTGLTLTDGYVNDPYGGAAVAAIFGASVALGDCVITGNNAGSSAYGGAVSAIYSSLSVNNCRFESNSVGAILRGGVPATGQAGGALLAFGSPSLVVENSQFYYNTAGQTGGAIAVFGTVDALIEGATINDNGATFGGGLAFGDSATASIADSIISGNDAAAGGGIAIGAQASITVSGSSVSSNQAAYDGGGLLVGSTYGGVVVPEPNAFGSGRGLSTALYGPGSAVLTDVDVVFNQSSRYGGGAAVKYDYSELGAIYSVFAYNQISGGGGGPIRQAGSFAELRGDGGGSYGGGGAVAAFSDGEARLYYDTLLVGNTAYTGAGGGGLAFDGGSIGLYESTVALNQAGTGGGLQAGLLPTPVAAKTGSMPDRGITSGGLVLATYGTIAANQASQGGGGILSLYGGIAAAGYSIISDNSAPASGGAGTYGGELLVKYSTVTNNQANYNGGGIYMVSPGCYFASVSGSIIAGNSANYGGGAYVGECGASIGYSTFVDNTAIVAGGLMVAGPPGSPPQLTNVTITGNEAETAGGLLAGGIVADFITVSHNVATGPTGPVEPGGIQLQGIAQPGGAVLDSAVTDVTVENSIFSDNTGPYGALDLAIIGGGNRYLDYSLIQAPAAGLPAGSGNITGYSAQLEALAGNGGPTPTRALAETSPAIDAANPVTSVSHDQRTAPFPRAFNGRADMGAYEFFIDGVFSDRFEQP
ncbi:MAG: hypothetical protein HND55_15215 [Pseudomonadota bacterium]|nr:MAG: hypothetical protein HND55_15215 [Pseudomonadota bacterium]